MLESEQFSPELHGGFFLQSNSFSQSSPSTSSGLDWEPDVPNFEAVSKRASSIAQELASFLTTALARSLTCEYG